MIDAWAYAAANVLQTQMRTAFVTTWTTALAHSTLAAFATVPVKSTSVDVPTFPLEIVTATAPNWTPLAFVVVIAMWTLTRTAFVTTKMIAWM